ncbi:MAG TPA: universal stress protein [Mycobacteriales bacterium]
MTYEGAVVVAVDDRDPDIPVLDWAAAEAAYRGTRLLVCHVCEWQSGQQAPRPMYESGDATKADLRIGPERVVGAALDQLRRHHPDLAVTGAIGTGNPTRGLLTVGKEAALIVVGARGVDGFAGLLMGSVSGQVAEHASCPVVVVRAARAGAADVVVGIDGSPESAHALELGLEQARRTGGALIALHAYRLPPVAAAYAPEPGVNTTSHRELAERTLTAALGEVEAANPDVKIERRVQHGPAARLLLAAAADAAVLVVGARGLGGFTGLVVGSVSQQVLRHAHCPVLVTR